MFYCKIFTVALGLEENLIEIETQVNTQGPLKIGGRRISDHKYFGPRLTVEEVIGKSSNIGTVMRKSDLGPLACQARLAQATHQCIARNTQGRKAHSSF